MNYLQLNKKGKGHGSTSQVKELQTIMLTEKGNKSLKKTCKL